MSRVTKARDVAAEPDEVWAVLAGFDDLAEWAPNVDHSCLLGHQTSGVGAVRRVQAGRNTLVERVETWVPGSMLSYTIEGLPPVVDLVTNTWVVRPTEGPHGGGTSVSLITDIDAGGKPVSRLLAKAVARKLGEASEAMLAGLEAHLTAETKQPT